jgi:hypothetical protein
VGGTLNVQLGNGFTPTVGESFDFISFAPGGLIGSFAGIQNDLFHDNTEQWAVTYDNTDGEVILTAEGASPSPEPSTMILLAIGLAGAVAWRTRRGLE